MLRAKARRSLFITVAVCFTLIGLSQSLLNVTAMQADEAALRAVVEKFYVAYGKRDLDSLMALWSEKSPDFATAKQTLQQQFATEDYTFGSSSISRVKIEGEKASLRAIVDLAATNLQSKQKREERIIHNIAFVKESGEWKVWRYAPAASDLAEALVKATTDVEREALLTYEKEMATPELVQALITQGIRFYNQGNYPQAASVFRLAQRIGEQIGDTAGIARSLNAIGNVYHEQGNNMQAVEYYQKSLAIREKLGDKRGIASTLNNVGTVYQSQGNYTQAIEYYQKSLAISEDIGYKEGAAVLLNNIGNVHKSQGNYTQALQHYQKSLAMKEALGDKTGIANTLGNIGVVYTNQGNYAQALEYLQRSLGVKETLGDKAGVADTLGNIGNVHDSQGNHAQALEYYQKSLAMKEVLGNKAGVAITLGNIGVVHSSQGNYGQAMEYYQKGLAISEAVGDRATTADALNNIGIVFRNQGNYGEALEYYQKSLAVKEALGNRAGIATTLGNIGDVHRDQGNYVQALDYHQKSLAMKESLGDKAGATNTLSNIGNVYNSQGNYTQALEYYRKSLAMKEALGDKAGVAITLGNIGVVHHSQSSYAQALEYYQGSLAMKETLGDKAGIAITLGNIGNVYNSQSNYVQALEYYQKSLVIRKALDDKAGIATILSNIGVLHNSQGNYAQALGHLRKSLSMRETLGDKAGIATDLGNIGVVYKSQGSYVQALEQYRKSLAMREVLGDKAGIATVLGNIGVVQLSQGNYAQALECFQTSLVMREALGDEAGIAATLHNIGIVHKEQGGFAQALDFVERAIALARQTGNLDTLWQARLTAGTAYRTLNQPVQAHQAFEEAIATIETIRAQVAGGEQEAQRFFANKLSPYLAMVDLLVTENNLAEALIYAERATARALLDVLQSGRVSITKAMTREEQERERELNNKLFSLNTQIYRERIRDKPDQNRLADLEKQSQKPRLEYEAFETNLYAAHPELKVRRGEAQILTLEEVGPLLPDAGTAALKFVVAEEKCSLFVLTKNAPGNQAAVEVKVFPIAIKQKDLTERVAQFRNQVAERDQAFARNAAAMFQLLITPARPLLQGKTTLIVVPDGPLWELPFQALQSPEGRYLLQDYAVFYAPSLTVLREMVKLRRQNRAPATTPTLLAVGNPALGQQTVKRIQDATMGEKLGPLPAAQRQVEELGKLYGQQRSKVYVGADATEERVKTESANYNILHLAAHGALNNRSPMYSHIVLSQMDEKGKEDGLLEAWELMKLDLKADLAVLSACETARGRVVGGEGVIGLTWALFVAGCPTTVVSQWKVNDQSTADLMVEFHRRLRTRSESLDSRNSIAQALRQAALKLLGKSQYQHPYYWAGFIVVGDGY